LHLLQAQESVIYSVPEEDAILLIDPTNDSVIGQFSREPVETSETSDGFSRFVTQDGKIKGKKWSFKIIGDVEVSEPDTEPEEDSVEEPEEDAEFDFDSIPIETEDEEPKEQKESRTRSNIKNLTERRKASLRRIKELNKL